MNYTNLVKAIQQRPQFFLKKLDLEELDAFLRGVSYANAASGHTEEAFYPFRTVWIPKHLPEHPNDWTEAVRAAEPNVDLFEHFFTLWEAYEADHVEG